MNGALQFMAGSPILTFCLVFMLSGAMAKMWAIFWRHWTIRKHGYPPAHCDADGDFKEEE